MEQGGTEASQFNGNKTTCVSMNSIDTSPRDVSLAIV